MGPSQYLYFDNGLFRKLVSEDGEDAYPEFLNLIFGAQRTEYFVIFTWFSLLEGVGLGRIKNRKNNDWRPCNFNMDQYRNKLERAPSDFFEKAKENYLKHPDLKKSKLIEKVEQQIGYSYNPYAKSLVKDTLERKLKEIQNDYDKCVELIAQNLAWDDACIFKYIDYECEAQHEDSRKKFQSIRVELLNILIQANNNGYVLNSYRLIETIVKELLTTPFERERLQQMNFDVAEFFRESSLDKRHDLCDVEVIHFATLGFAKSAEESYPVRVFSCDSFSVLEKRLAIQQSIIPSVDHLKIMKGKAYSVALNLKKVNKIPL